MRTIVAGLIVGISLTTGAADAQTQAPIRASDGDVIIVEGDARVRLVRRREANVTAIHSPTERWVLVMADFARGGKPPDGRVDSTFRFHQVSAWPLGERWSGAIVLDEYSHGAEMGPTAIGLTTDNGLIQILGPPDDRAFRDPAAATVVSFLSGGRGGGNNQTFEDAEISFVAQMRQAAQRLGTPPGTSSGGVSGGVPPSPGSQPVRVGGNIKTPSKVVHVDPVIPARAVQARISGMVIVEATIGVDGSITDVKVLRSIPLLDEAAVEAVRQWKFTPTTLNGVPVPVVMTLTVNFPQ